MLTLVRSIVALRVLCSKHEDFRASLRLGSMPTLNRVSTSVLIFTAEHHHTPRTEASECSSLSSSISEMVSSVGMLKDKWLTMEGKELS